MTSGGRGQIDQARRHFLGLTAAAGARIAAISALAATILLPSSMAEAAWWKEGHPGQGNGNGRDGSRGGPMCLLRGTSITTPMGEVRIEDLRIGDLVQTVRGKAMPVKWIGRHIYRRSGPTWTERVMPIRIARFALNQHTPSKDLYLSAGHALLIDGMLIRAADLVNATSISPAVPADRDIIEYFQIVLHTHEVVLAEGVPVETFLLGDHNYEGFTNFAEFARLYPADQHATMTPFAPFACYGGREHLKGLLRLGAARLIPVHSPLQDACDRIAARSRELIG
ncbi:Hint domain-containing protein [Sinorhizobium numidicum]|uniref:Hint domain-containing protein n=1 Tax=Sinorhizobium numidicum TaxID=680248 RepID=A0ABY8CQW1_9HYPH|nr:Hint domain-containing protein [Sinorhizobium numidicum]WEX75015.1 Hint domain-containing protein [Sinorhizobium numidicum]WEX81009.1 Hint domain-containing protein [Sinorhizobium numidicum]